jgi:hypothetical protein
LKLWLLYVAAVTVSAAAPPQPACGGPQTPKALWRAPQPMSTGDWICGPGGCSGKPVPPFQFLKADSSGTSPKLDVRDARGRTWSVKFGAEVIPECFGSRFLMALGYVAEPTYCMADFRVGALPGLPRRIGHAMQSGGTFGPARFELRGEKDFEFLPRCAWGWADNPFLGSHELAGLKIVMMLLSNWDAKDARMGENSNNGVFRTTRSGKPEMLYSVFDWGASLGSWGGSLRRDQSDCAGFASDTPRFVKVSGNGRIDWGFYGKFSDDLKAGVGRSDIRWLLPYLERITPDQLRAGLTASGATPRQANCWASSLQERIRQLQVAAR